ncbi:hypothetical protein PR048_019200 [Dryococelus australis]|uniref:Uncharacterized protein n=1 Tax=Dryococelus australis TaxID=614101 RepID=A0ABQ9H2Y4_9NEOP|nr:hypothetical protein PR048_019200 [Dryococelus australis]
MGTPTTKEPPRYLTSVYSVILHRKSDTGCSRVFLIFTMDGVLHEEMRPFDNPILDGRDPSEKQKEPGMIWERSLGRTKRPSAWTFQAPSILLLLLPSSGELLSLPPRENQRRKWSPEVVNIQTGSYIAHDEMPPIDLLPACRHVHCPAQLHESYHYNAEVDSCIPGFVQSLHARDRIRGRKTNVPHKGRPNKCAYHHTNKKSTFPKNLASRTPENDTSDIATMEITAQVMAYDGNKKEKDALALTRENDRLATAAHDSTCQNDIQHETALLLPEAQDCQPLTQYLQMKHAHQEPRLRVSSVRISFPYSSHEDLMAAAQLACAVYSIFSRVRSRRKVRYVPNIVFTRATSTAATTGRTGSSSANSRHLSGRQRSVGWESAICDCRLHQPFVKTRAVRCCSTQQHKANTVKAVHDKVSTFENNPACALSGMRPVKLVTVDRKYLVPYLNRHQKYAIPPKHPLVIPKVSEENWAALNIEVLRADEGEARRVWSNAGIEGRGKREIPEKNRRPTASSATIPTCENPEEAIFLGGGGGGGCNKDRPRATSGRRQKGQSQRKYGAAGQQNLGTQFTNKRPVTYSPAGSPANRGPCTACTSQPDTRPVPIVTRRSGTLLVSDTILLTCEAGVRGTSSRSTSALSLILCPRVSRLPPLEARRSSSSRKLDSSMCLLRGRNQPVKMMLHGTVDKGMVCTSDPSSLSLTKIADGQFADSRWVRSLPTQFLSDYFSIVSFADLRPTKGRLEPLPHSLSVSLGRLPLRQLLFHVLKECTSGEIGLGSAVVTHWTSTREDTGSIPGPAILISVFHGFPKSLQANPGMGPEQRPRSIPSHSFTNPSSLCNLHRL